MGIINVLDTQTSNMIAAGEVVDRPASAIKEMVENAVDAGATKIAVEVKGGGMLFISVSDNGCGIMRDDLPKTILRHATSKIKTGSDLDGVSTLGFRGEALAAISSVSVLEIISKRRGDTFGSRLSCDETGVELYEAGCPDGTTVTVRNLFYNVPARRKFMKKDSSETAACAAVCEKLALSHPEISVSFTADGVRRFKTSGDGKLYSVIYTLYGSEFAHTLCEVTSEQDGITVSGFVSKPEFPRGSRQMQSFFINGRYVKSKTVQAAVEEAYRSYIPSGKFPAALLFVTLDPKKVDVNVHPAKTEIKLSDEKAVFSAVYYAVLGALAPTPPQKKQPTQSAQPTQPSQTAHSRQKQDEKPPQTYERPFVTKPSDAQPAKAPPQSRVTEQPTLTPKKAKLLFDPSIADGEVPYTVLKPSPYITLRENTAVQSEQPDTTPTAAAEDKANAAAQITLDTGEDDAPSLPRYRIIGEAYNTYIFAELDDKLLIIDKHAAHERLIYEELKSRNLSPAQQLLFPVTLRLPADQCELLLSNAKLLESYGFVVEPFGAGFAVVRAVPSRLADLKDLSAVLEGFAQEFSASSTLALTDRADKALYTVACKAAVKAGDRTHTEDADDLVRRILETGVRYCPHGRPFVKELDKKTLEKFFDR